MPLNKIVKLVENEIENFEFANDITLKNNHIAAALKIDPSELSRFRNGSKMLHLDKIVKLIRFLCPDKELEVMENICRLLLKTGKPYIIREAMEYTSTARLLGTLHEIINDQLKNGNKENKELAKIYAIALKYQKTRGNFNELLMEVENTLPTRKYSKLLLLLIKCIILQYKKEFSHMDRVLKEAEVLLDDVYDDTDFLLRSYKIRLIEIKSIVTLNVYCDLIEARRLANQVINSEICAVFKVHSYYTLGKSYLFDDYDKCIFFFKKYHDMLLSDGRGLSARIVKEQDMTFAKIVHGQELESIKTNDLSEIAHLEARWGDKQKALKLIEQAVKEQGMSVFKQYYKALALNDPMLLYESLIAFINSGMKFYATLVYRDLLKHGNNWGTISRIALEGLSFR